MQCPRCERDAPADATFCPKCGSRLAIACPQCGSACAPDDNFCRRCGQSLSLVATDVGERFATPQAYTPHHLAEKILTSKSALEGERKQVTVLFADLKGSMELLADRDPDEARKILDPVLERMMEAVHHYEGTVNQVMGDGIMALFGAPIAHEDHAVRACYAALRMQESVVRYREDTRQATGADVQIRIGLNSGDVVVRSIGSDLRMDYSAVGQTTHLAARMEQLASPGTVYATAPVRRLVEGHVTAVALGPTVVKGLPEPVDVWEITGTTSPAPFETPTLTPFVGRDDAMRQLLRALGLTEKGEGQVVAVVGEPGIGKSRLFWEFLHDHVVSGWTILRGRSVSYGKATAYLPIVDLLKRGFQIGDGDSGGAIVARVRDAVTTLDSTLARDVPALLAVLGVLSEDRQWEQLDPPQRRERVLDALRRLVLRLAIDRPVVLVVEDLHWIDEGTQDVLDAVVDAVPNARILLLVSYRPEYRHAWSGKSFYTQIRLDPLSAEVSGGLLDALLGADVTLVDLRQELIERTQGNPFFLEESVRHLVETGVLGGPSGARRMVGITPRIHVPVTVQGVLASRIDRLSTEHKRLLQAAAVVGKDVPLPVLERVAEIQGGELRQALSRLQGAELFREVRTFPEPIYTFKHALTHEVTYGTLLADRKQHLHAAVLRAMESLYAARLTEQAEILAEHAIAGAVWDRAVDYLLQASAKAYMRGVISDALARAEEAVETSKRLSPDIDNLRRRVDAMLELWAPLAMSGQFERLEAMTYQLVESARALNEGGRLGQALLKLGGCHYITGRYEEMQDCTRESIEAASDDPAVRLQAPVGLGIASECRGDYKAAIQYFKQIADGPEAELAKRRFTIYVPPYISATARLAWASAQTGDFEQAAASAARATEAAAEMASPVSLAVAHHFKAMALASRGDFTQALIDAETAVQQCETHGVLSWLPAASAICGFVRSHAVPSEEALAQVARGASVHAAIGVKTYLSWITRLWAGALFLSGADDKARVRAEHGLGLARQFGERGEEAEVLLLLADIALNRPDVPVAATLYGEALELAGKLGMRPVIARCQIGLGRVSKSTGANDAAKQQIMTAMTMLREMGMTYWLEKATRDFETL